ncbi:MAG: hypothetical protein QM708_15690 [Propioniciclava sp.]|uniref:COG1470 family protein n=1 Tax=Propioniciclava sp. TaxID=2038686 RepID=UPI0039E67C8E
MHARPQSSTTALAWRVVITLALLWAVGVGLAIPAHAQTVTWSVVPADAGGPDGRVSLRHTLEPGQRVQDAIAVTNSGDVPATFVVAVGDGVAGPDGAFDIDARSHDGAGGWITVQGTDNGSLTLAPGASVVLPVHIDVPATALPGDHPAGITVGVVQGADVQLNYRVGVRLHLQVAGEIRPALGVDAVSTRFEPSWIPFAPGTLSVDYRITNDGNVRLGAAGRVSVSGPFGLAATDSEPDEVTELLPGDARERTVTFAVPSLFWLNGQLTVTPRAVGQDALSLPDATTVALAAPAASWTGSAALALAIGAAVLVIRRRRSVSGASG